MGLNGACRVAAVVADVTVRVRVLCGKPHAAPSDSVGALSGNSLIAERRSRPATLRWTP
jgi:hypothetical protein